MGDVPFIAFGNDELARKPELHYGQSIKCPKGCGAEHLVKGGRNEVGDETDTLLFYDCGSTSYLCGVDGRSIV